MTFSEDAFPCMRVHCGVGGRVGGGRLEYVWVGGLAGGGAL